MEKLLFVLGGTLGAKWISIDPFTLMPDVPKLV
jgi:hypothetical protein